jgi:hypothetical protein
MAAIAALLLNGVLGHAKKFLDSDKEYDEKLSFVITKNREVVRQRLQYMADDLTNVQSEYSLHTLNNESFVLSRTVQVAHCFRRMRRCRTAMRGASFGCEMAKWTAYAGFGLIVGFVVFNLLSLAPLVKWDGLLLGASVVLCFVSMGFADLCLQVVRRQHSVSITLDASIPS